MTPTAIIDTNILVYTYDKQDPKRQVRARDTLLQLKSASAGYLSVKTLSEFFVVIRRIPHQLTNAQALREVEIQAAIWPVLDLTLQL